MNKIKKISYGVASLALVAPAAALAQFEKPTGTQLPQGSVTGILTSFMNWVLMIVGILGVIAFVIAGIYYLTAAGDEDNIAKGKKLMIAAITGIVVALIGLVVIQAIQGLLGGSGNNF